ncbi:hypothetical protein R1sor_019310 [Riccia sorocarpa]|uniref:Uncharacterized protein n=1 Tax=Riccia sorocarpa TaxID=122646 RepID=A0ABD3IC67_9MARC
MDLGEKELCTLRVCLMYRNFWANSLKRLQPVAEKPRADPKTVVSVILGGGAGTCLFPITKRRVKPASSEGAGVGDSGGGAVGERADWLAGDGARDEAGAAAGVSGDGSTPTIIPKGGVPALARLREREERLVTMVLVKLVLELGDGAMERMERLVALVGLTVESGMELVLHWDSLSGNELWFHRQRSDD